MPGQIRRESGSEPSALTLGIRLRELLEFQTTDLLCHHTADMTRGMAGIGDRIRIVRSARGLTQLELARRASISRQALGAIESGLYQPGVVVALGLARELGETVETLFAENGETSSTRIDVPWSEPKMAAAESAACKVALARVAGKLVAVPQPAARLWLSPAAGIVDYAGPKRAAVSTYWSQAEIDATLLIAGCDPAVAILADWLARRRSPVTAVALRCSSSKALSMLAKGGVHVAGVHLRDPKSGEYNLKSVRSAIGRRPLVMVNFARWELGLAVTGRNPMKIRGFADLVRPRIRIVNRETGSGARLAFDEA